MIRAPLSSYSFLETHIFLKVSRAARMEPPIHVEYSRSCGADILILTSFGVSFFISESSRSPNPGRQGEKVDYGVFGLMKVTFEQSRAS